MKTLFNQEITDELFDHLMCEQSNGKEIKIVDGKIVAVERVITEKEKAIIRINELKNLLRDYDYIGTKIATGRGTREEYATQIAQMTEWAEEINKLEAEINDN